MTLKDNVSEPSPDFSRYLARFVLVLSFGILAVTALVVVVDPYGIYGVVAPSRFNAIKPGLTRYQTEIKQVRVAKFQPDFVIIGNSRAEIGLDPKADAFRPMHGKGFNLAIAGTGIVTSAMQLAQLQAAGIQPKLVVFGIEFLDYVPSATEQSHPVAELAEPAPIAPSGPVHWQFDTLFSLASLKDTVRTLGIQHDKEATTIDQDGFNPLKEYLGYVRNDGFYKIFAQRAQENARAFHRKSTSSLKANDLARLQTTLDTAASMNAEVKIIIYPYHAQILAMFEEAGLWPLFGEWKHRVILAVEQTKRTHPGAKISVYDFSGFGSYNCERIPNRGEVGNVTKWYWEGGHFKKQLGDIVLTRAMSASNGEPDTTPFGYALRLENEQANKDRIASERSACVASQPATFASARQLMDSQAHGN